MTSNIILSDHDLERGEIKCILALNIFGILLKGGRITVAQKHELLTIDGMKSDKYSLDDKVIIQKKDDFSVKGGGGPVLDYYGVNWYPGPTYSYEVDGTTKYYI